MRSNAKADVEARRDAWLARLQAELDRMLELLKARPDVEQVILFGSLARKQAGARSDLDLVIIQDTPKRFLDRLADFYAYLGPRVEADILVYTPDEWNTLPEKRFFSNACGRKEWCSMQPNTHEEAQRWLAEAEEDVAVARVLMESRHFSHACFHAQQAGEKAMKSLLCLCNVEEPWGHSVSKLIEEGSTYDPALMDLFQAGTILDRYYIPTRCPNGLPTGSLPSKSFHAADAQEAIRLAQTIIRRVQQVRDVPS